jgi:hypothetical protein
MFIQAKYTLELVANQEKFEGFEKMQRNVEFSKTQKMPEGED